MKTIYLTVTNDLNYDQRMIRICSALHKNGYNVYLIGREKKNSSALYIQPYNQIRLFCYFEKGKLFYLEYNFRLFFFLLFKKLDAVCSIDLDTILPGFIVCFIRRKYRIYDAHELFTELPELEGRKLTKTIWKIIEKIIVPRYKFAYTVCDSLKNIFNVKYKVNFKVIRNVPYEKKYQKIIDESDKFIILYQGVLNDGRGLEQMIEAMVLLENCELWIAGEGDLSKELREKVIALSLEKKVIFLGYVNPIELKEITQKAHIGINLLENKGLNYYYSLANKFFDYIQARKPSINMNFPEYSLINKQYEVAVLIDDLKKEKITAAINKLKNNELYYNSLIDNCAEAAKEYVWEIEEKKLLSFYKNIFNNE